MTTDKLTADNIIRFGLIALIVVWSIKIISPFISVLLWAIIIAVSAYPAFIWLESKIGDRSGWAATIFVLLLLILMIGPIAASLPGFADSIRSLASQIQSGSLAMPEASEKVRQWPIIGEQLYGLWQQASTNLAELLVKFRPQLRDASITILGSIAAAGLAILQFVIAVVIAGVILAHHGRTALCGHFEAPFYITLFQFGTFLAVIQATRFTLLGDDRVKQHNWLHNVIGITLPQLW